MNVGRWEFGGKEYRTCDTAVRIIQGHEVNGVQKGVRVVVI